MLLLGCKPLGRHIEQHDIFFSIGRELKDFVPQILEFWPEADAKVHIDAFRPITSVEGYRIEVIGRDEATDNEGNKLYFVNLGGYRPKEFEEYHFKRIVIGNSLADAIKQAKNTVFWDTHDSPHIDDKYALDVDDLYDVEDLLPASIKAAYALKISKSSEVLPEDEVQNGYFKLSRL